MILYLAVFPFMAFFSSLPWRLFHNSYTIGVETRTDVKGQMATL